MPSKKTIMWVISVYIMENNIDPCMRSYIWTVLERGKSQAELTAMTKEEVWGLVAYFAKDLQKTIRDL
ncbi:hypothetical protein EC991_011498, partial [Linnemannia zychae]